MSRITRFLIPVSWTLWGILLLVLLWAFVDSIANPVYTPEVSPQVGPMVMGALLIVFVGFGLLLRWAARRRSTGCLIALTLMLAYVFFMLIAILVFEAWNDWQIEREISRFDERSLPTATCMDAAWVPPFALTHCSCIIIMGATLRNHSILLSEAR